MDNLTLFLYLWGIFCAPYVLPFVIGKLWKLVWWLPEVGKWYQLSGGNAYRITYVGNLTISGEDRNGTKAIFTFSQFRRWFKRKPVTLKTKAGGYAQSAKKLSKKRLTYRELQSRNILLDNEVKRLHAEVKVLRVNPGLKQRFGVKVEASTEPGVLEEVTVNGCPTYSRKGSTEDNALQCAKDLREYAKEIREGVKEAAPLLIPVLADNHLCKESPMFLIFGEKPCLIVHHKTLELLKPMNHGAWGLHTGTDIDGRVFVIDDKPTKPKEAAVWCQKTVDGTYN